MQSPGTSIKISGPMSEVKKICIGKRLINYYCILKKIQAKRGVEKQFWLVPDTVRWQGTETVELSLETVFPALKLLYKYENFFFLKTGNLIIHWILPFSPLKT